MLQIPRSENSEADSLAKALELTEEITRPSIEEKEVMNTQVSAE